MQNKSDDSAGAVHVSKVVDKTVPIESARKCNDDTHDARNESDNTESGGYHSGNPMNKGKCHCHEHSAR